MNISLMTFNLRNYRAKDGDNAWPYRVHKVAETIRVNNPLILGVQESYLTMIEDLHLFLPEYAWLGEGREGGEQGEYCAIFYKNTELTVVEQGQFWLSETPNVAGSKSWDSSLSRICTWARFQFISYPEQHCVVFNTHLDHVGQQAREEGPRLIWQHLQPLLNSGEVPVALMGDFNAHPDNPAIRFLNGQLDNEAEHVSFNDVHTLENRPAGLTFHGFRGGEAGEPIDYIFINKRLKVLQLQVDRRTVDGGYPSDHYPIVAKCGLA